ncbi:MAG: 16S rRNA (adenine(1518)-N(6)/adenine(1519)-N(6))-dimethyltransferase RsmA [Chlamydiota bacterium]
MGTADAVPGSVKGILASLGIAPSKRRGQTFLIRREVAERIAGLASLTPDDAVLEIGPGLGALTGALLAAAGRVVAVESDRRLAAWLRDRFRDCRTFELIHADALTCDIPGLLKGMAARGRRVKVVSNIPYSISGPLIARLLGASDDWSCMVLTVQRELARRITAPPGGKEYGAFTVLCRCRAETGEAFTIAPGAFYPRPGVDSSVVVFRSRPSPLIPAAEEAAFFSLVRLLFSQRRKSIGTVLKRALKGHPAAETLRGAFASAGIDPAVRPERLGVEEFRLLGEALGRVEWKADWGRATISDCPREC